jgi:site-specific DNA recombinase
VLVKEGLLRLLGAVRLSALTDETTSPERQGEQITLTAKARGDTVVRITEDLDVSGAVSPFDRDQLGPWLTEPAKVALWDGLIVAKLDRLSRSLLDFALLLKWCEDNGKTIISVSENLDFSTPMGRMFGNILIMFAEFERARMAERRKEAKDKLDLTGRWGGGTVQFGYRADKTDGGWVLTPDPVTAPEVRRMAEQVIAGRSARDIAGELRKREIPSSQGGQWGHSTVIAILRSPALKGLVMSNGSVVRNADGMPVKREAILSGETWDQVQAALDKTRPSKSSQRGDAAPLLRVAYCVCGQPLYIMRKTGRNYAYYVCASKTQGTGCTEKSIRSDLLESLVEDTLLKKVGKVPHREKVIYPAEDHAAEIAEVNEAIENLEADRYERGLFSGDNGAARYAERMRRLEARQAALEILPSHAERIEWPETGRTFAEHWQSLTEPQRRTFLVDAGVKVYVKEDDGQGLNPWPDFSGRTDVVRLTGQGWEVTVYLATLAELKEMASQAGQAPATPRRPAPSR